MIPSELYATDIEGDTWKPTGTYNLLEFILANKDTENYAAVRQGCIRFDFVLYRKYPNHSPWCSIHPTDSDYNLTRKY